MATPETGRGGRFVGSATCCQLLRRVRRGACSFVVIHNSPAVATMTVLRRWSVPTHIILRSDGAIAIDVIKISSPGTLVSAALMGRQSTNTLASFTLPLTQRRSHPTYRMLESLGSRSIGVAPKHLP